jgi:hypothetical protein
VPACDEARTRQAGEAVTTKPVTSAEVARTIFDALGNRDLGTALAPVADDSVDDFVAIW